MTVRINKQKINLREKLAGAEEKVNFEDVVRGFGEYDGNIGIGTTGPTDTLHIKGDHKGLIIGSDDYNLLLLRRRSSNHPDSAGLFMYDEGVNKITLDSAGPTYFMGGNLGIGTVDPDTSLDINKEIGESSPIITLSRGGISKSRFAIANATSSILHGSIIDDLCIRTEGGNIRFGTASATKTDMSILSNGNVGIGTTNPGARLNIIDAQRLSNIPAVSASGQLRLSNISTNGGTWGIHTTANGWNAGGGGKLGFFADDNSNQARMMITQAGNVGIGTTNPTTRFHIKDDDSNTSLTSANNRSLTIQDTSEEDDALSTINFNTSNNFSSAMIGVRATTNLAGPSVRSDIIFVNRNSDNGFTEKMVIKAGGNVGIGTTIPGCKLDVRGGDDTYVAQFIAAYTDPGNASHKGIRIIAGQGNSGTTGSNKWIEFYNGNGSTIIGGIQNTNNTTVAFFSGSDRRIKKNINDTSIKGIDSIKALKLRSWDWNSTEPMTSVDIGIIADELEEVYPELISRQKIDGWEHCIGEGEEDLKTIPTESKITLTLIKAVQEQQQTIEDLKSRIETLEQQ